MYLCVRAFEKTLMVFLNEQATQLTYATYPCALGQGGVVAEVEGREGDKKTPLGKYQLRYGLYRADRISLPVNPKKLALPFYPLSPIDAWCDDVNDPAYNRHIVLPYQARHEALYRESPVYDIIVVLSHNANPPVLGKGSAVFLHIAHDDYRPTQGCVAISRPHMLALLPFLRLDSVLDIKA